MAHTCKIFSPEDVGEIFDKANKVGWKEDSLNRFRILDFGKEDKHGTFSSYQKYIYNKLNENQDYSAFVVPRKTSIPLLYISSEEHSETWQYHRDDLNSSDMNREYSVILFMSDPDEYEGGEISIRIGGTESVYKLPKGVCIIFPTSTYVKVSPVASGTRILCRWTIETYVKNAEMFNINLQYNQLYRAFRENLSPQADEVFTLTNNMLLNEIANFDLDD